MPLLLLRYGRTIGCHSRGGGLIRLLEAEAIPVLDLPGDADLRHARHE
jgi:hypothetical protein